MKFSSPKYLMHWKHLAATALVLVTATPILAEPVVAQEEWQTLFNGRDLTGWRADAHPDSWSVVDGTLRTQATKSMSHLFFVGEQPAGEPEEKEAKPVRLKNFVLELSARSEKSSNSGVFFHTDMDLRNAGKRLLSGYEVQLNSSAVEKRKTGSLYAIVDLPESPVDESQWFQVRITVQDKHITVQLNEATVVDYTEPGDVKRPADRAGRKINPEGGAIALQGHDPKSIFYFKDIRIKRLP